MRMLPFTIYGNKQVIWINPDLVLGVIETQVKVNPTAESSPTKAATKIVLTDKLHIDVEEPLNFVLFKLAAAGKGLKYNPRHKK